MFKYESNNIIFDDMHKHFLVKYLVEIWYKLQRVPINQDGGSTSITHGSKNWNHVQWLSFCLLHQSHRVGSSKPLPSKLFVGQKTLTSQFKNENPHHPHVTKMLTPAHHPLRSPFTPAQAPPRLCHGTAYHGGKHLARRLPPPGCRQSPPHFATSACRRLSPSSFSMLLAIDPAPLGWGICRTEGSFSWTTR